MSDIHLVSMPFEPTGWPSPGIGVLVAAAQNAGLDVQADYCSLRFAKKIGVFLYNFCVGKIKSEMLFGEWIFAGAAYKGIQTPSKKFPLDYISKNAILKAVVNLSHPLENTTFWENFHALPEIAEIFIQDEAQTLLEQCPKIVGCSTSFQQYNASLALLRQLKTLRPEIVTILGGANCEAELGYVTVKNFPWIDFVVSGEADSLFPRLCRQILDNGVDLPAQDLPYGVYSRRKLPQDHQTFPERLKTHAEVAIEHDLSKVPIPDYTDYFEEIDRLELRQQVSPELIIETSRGCWKGYEQPCNFCGLTGNRCVYRTKPPERVLQELALLSQKYGISRFRTSDCILYMGYFKSVFKTLAEQHAPYTFYFETSSRLNEQQVKMLAEAGIIWLQPGVESLHDELLKLLNKGNSSIDNIALLKYTFEYNIVAYWNILYNIPGEADSYYQEMAELLPLLYHLQPPNLIPIRFDRFSQYVEKSHQFGLNLVPSPLYQSVYPFDGQDLESFAYFYIDTNDGHTEKTMTPGLKALNHRVYHEWRPAFCGIWDGPLPQLSMSETGNELIIHDTRPCAVASQFIFIGLERLVYRGCRKPITKAHLYDWLCGETSEHAFSIATIEAILEQLIEKKLLLRMNDRFLALATFANDNDTKYLRQVNELDKILQKKRQQLYANHQKVWEWFASLSV